MLEMVLDSGESSVYFVGLRRARLLMVLNATDLRVAGTHHMGDSI